MREFFSRYPGLKEEQISNEAQFTKSTRVSETILKNPDMSFCNFIISLCMFLLSLFTFYSQRDFNNEYFNRQLIYRKLTDNPLGFVNYN